MSVEGLSKLKVWMRAKELVVVIYRQVLPLLPVDEKWNLGQQLQRSCASVPANIAEGYGRFYFQDNVRFCYHARGSLEETLSHLLLAFELGYIPDTLWLELKLNIEETEKMLNGYIAFLKKSKQGLNEPGADHVLREDASLYEAEWPQACEQA